MRNELGEEISDKEIIDLTKRVVKLLDKEIDALWFSCGWIVENHEEEFKSLRNEDLRYLRHSFEYARRKVSDLLEECHIEEFRTNLTNVEKISNRV